MQLFYALIIKLNLPTILNNEETTNKTNIVQGGDDLCIHKFFDRLRPETRKINENENKKKPTKQGRKRGNLYKISLKV